MLMRKAAALSLVLLVIPATVAAQEQTNPAVLYGNLAVYVNGQPLPTTAVGPNARTESTVVAVGDVVQTKDGGDAMLSSVGSTAKLQSNTIVRFQSGGLALDRGGISVNTVKQSSVFARDYKITPVAAVSTDFDVLRVSGVIKILARKNNVTVSCGTRAPVVVKQGQELAREDGADCGLAERQGGAPSAAKGPVLDSATAEKAGLAAGAGLLGWVLFQSDDPVSPSAP
jgi:hypothetical protein